MFGPSGFWTTAPLRYAAKFDPFLSLDCAPTPSTLAQSKERKGSNFAIWQPCFKEKDDVEDNEDDDDIDAAKKSAVSNFMGSGAITKSSSTSNLAVKSIAKKFSFGKIGRRISDLHVSGVNISMKTI